MYFGTTFFIFYILILSNDLLANFTFAFKLFT